ncbi:MAG: hypothetical protein K8R57_03375 [Verrucomicrobia bacterium]|nr:hypothetical protein [Verrucomicrobiota bacterium]
MHKGFEVDSIFYSLKDVSWQVFLSLHFKDKGEDEKIQKDFTSDSRAAGKNRRDVVRNMVWGARRTLGLAQNDLIHVSNSEKQGHDRCHIHALIATKEKAGIESNSLLNAIKANAPWNILYLPFATSEEKSFMTLDGCIDAVAYYCKRNKNDFKERSETEDISRLAICFIKQ